jgi:hypothetical protein
MHTLSRNNNKLLRLLLTQNFSDVLFNVFHKSVDGRHNVKTWPSTFVENKTNSVNLILQQERTSFEQNDCVSRFYIGANSLIRK